MSTRIEHRERVGSVDFPTVQVHLDRESTLSDDLTHVTEHHTNHIVLQFGHGEAAFYSFLSMAAAEDLRDALKQAQERWTEPVEPLPAWERELLERQTAEAASAVQEDLRTPAEWQRELGVVVMDPDGWRPPQEKSWAEPISRSEFIDRAGVSTTTELARSQVADTPKEER